MMATTTAARGLAQTVITPLTPSDLLKTTATHDYFSLRLRKPSTRDDLDTPNEWSATNTTGNTSDNTAAHTGINTQATTPENFEARFIYDSWHCPFDSSIDCEPMDVQSQPTTEIAFLYHVEAQIQRNEHIEQGFEAYKDAINGGNHYTFPEDFLTNQNFAIATTTDHLHIVKRDLENMHTIITAWKKMDHGQLPVQWVHREGLAAAKVWLEKQSKLLVHCHCFYKTNYALASETKVITC